MSSVRRVYYYLVCLITLGIFAGGVGVLLSLIFDILTSSSEAVGQTSFNQQQLSLGLAMLVTGGPLWFIFWRSIRKYTDGNKPEIGSTLRKFFINLILIVSSLVVVYSGQSVFSWLIAGFPPNHDIPASLATFLVSFSVWIFHWRIAEAEGCPSSSARTLRRWYVYIASGWGLVLFAIGIIQLVDNLFRSLPIWGPSLTVNIVWNTSLHNSISSVMFGGLLWAFHWFYMSRSDTHSVLRQVYIYLLAIIVSSITCLVSLTIGLYRTLIWIMGTAVNTDGSYFQFFGWVIPTILVMTAVWVYHQSLAKEEAGQIQERLLSSRRIHLYIMSFIGLGTLVSGLIVLIGILLDTIIQTINPAVAIETGWWQNQLSLALALLIVATPLWLYYWNRITRLSDGGGITEWKAISRRIYLYIIIGASIVGLAAVLVNIIYQFLGGALGGNLNINVLQNSKWSIQVLLIAVPLLIYHWQIARTDQHRGAESSATRKTITLVVEEQYRNLIEEIEKLLGSPVRVFQYTCIQSESTPLSGEVLAQAVLEVKTSHEKNILLIIREGKVLVIPYREQ